MSHVSAPAPPPGSGFASIGFRGRLALAAAVLCGLVAALAVMGRHPVCPCGIISLVQTHLSAAQNSQQFADWYSALHVIFGMGLFAFIHWMRPAWPLGTALLAVLIGHTMWELTENTPFVVAVFSGTPNAPDYSGDSILNSLGDTVFALSGAFLASRLSARTTIALALTLELAVTVAIDDGLIVGTLRLVGAPV